MQFRLKTAIALLISLLAFVGQAAERHVLTGHRPPIVAQLQALGNVPATTRMDLAIGLPLRNRQGLDSFLQQLYDPRSPDYHHYLTPEQFTERFGPTEQDYQKVISFAESHGMKVTHRHPNRLLLDVSAPAEEVEKAFRVHMRVYRHPTEARTFFAPDTEPSVDAGLPVMQISGLNNYLTARPASLHIRPFDPPGRAKTSAGSGQSGTYLGGDFRAAYVPGVSLDGTGESVALLEFEGYYANDIANYESRAGLSAVTLTNVYIDGFNGIPDTNVNAVAEVSLDIEMAISMAPKLSRVVVYEASGPNLTLTELNDLLNQMVTDNLAKQISSSWSWGGGTNASSDQAFIEMAAQGQSFYEASGDSGAYHGTISQPSDDPYIIVVGGTTLTTTGAGGSWSSEKVWSWFPASSDASSGGVSTVFAIPSWQQGIDMTTNQGSTTMRNIPDVALTADNIFVVYNNGSQGDFGGTSCAAPLWAAFTALANQHGAAHSQSPVGFINPAVYAIGKGANYASDFHDITVGNNTNRSSRTKYFAEPGYDLCTGWGTPNGTNTINGLLPGLSPINPTVTWTNPASFVYGTALSGSQLNATAGVPGTFAYSPPAGSVLNAGTNVLSVVFTPSDTYDYNAATDTVSLVVTPALLSVTANNTARVYGQNNPAFTASYNGFVNGENANVLSGAPSLTTTATITSSVTGSPYPVVAATGTLSASNYTFTFNDGQLTITPASTTVAVSSSLNPALEGSNVTFSATLSVVSPGSGAPTGTVQFYADSAALGAPVAWAGGMASTDTSSLSPGAHVMSAQYAGDGNFSGSTGSLSPNERIDVPPMATNIVLQRAANSGAKISVAALLAQSAGPNSGALTLLSADSTSTNGGSVVVTNNWILYTPLAGFTNADAFGYVFGDSEGLQAAGTVSILIPLDNSQSENIVSVGNPGGNTSVVNFQGISGRAYTIQYTESLQSPAWQTVGTSTANATGAFSFTNTPPDGWPAGFYRSIYP